MKLFVARPSDFENSVKCVNVNDMDYDREQREIRKIERFLDCTDRRILEVGCGDGRVSGLLAPKTRAYVAIDTDPQRLDKARSTWPGVDFRLGNGEALEFTDGSFDGVLFTLSLHHQESRVALQTGRVLVLFKSLLFHQFQSSLNLFPGLPPGR